MTYAILVQGENGRKMEAELQELRREQNRELRNLEQARQETEAAIEQGLAGKTKKVSWSKRTQKGRKRLS